MTFTPNPLLPLPPTFGQKSALCPLLQRNHPSNLFRMGYFSGSVLGYFSKSADSLRSAGIKTAPGNTAILDRSPPVPSSGEPPLPDTHSGATRYSPHRYHFSLLNTARCRRRDHHTRGRQHTPNPLTPPKPKTPGCYWILTRALLDCHHGVTKSVV